MFLYIFKRINMKQVLTVVLFLLSLHCSAQIRTVDSVLYRFNYAMKYTSFEGGKRFDDEMVVDIGKNKVHNYGYWDVRNGFLIDSIRGHGGDIADYFAMGTPVAIYDAHILKNYPQKGMLTYTQYEGKSFIYNEPIMKKNWILEEGDTTILGYTCKKASCTFRHRSWKVWYALDLPFSEGPWKLDGLPGMILKAEDTKGQYLFECIGIKEHVNQPMQLELDKRVRISPIRLEQLRKLAKKDYPAYLKAVGETKIINPYKGTPKTACLLEYYEPNKK